MAGIGFVLRNLYRKGDISSKMRAFFHAALATSGPWLITVFTIASLFILNRYLAKFQLIEEFKIIILYNFCFSLVFTSPISITATRYLSDSIYARNLKAVTGLLIGSLTVLLATLTPPAVLFYFGYANFETPVALLAVINFLIICCIWQTSIFITAIKYFSPVTWSFLVGMAIAFFAGTFFGKFFGAIGLLFGFTLGLLCILSSLLGVVLAEYPVHFENIYRFTGYFRSHWQIGLGGLFYGLGLWADKWIMWFSPESVVLPSGLIMYPYYDSSMFIAYLTIIPAMAFFMINQETQFYEYYLNFYRSIQQNCNYKMIEQNHKDLIGCFLVSAKKILILQGVICIVTLFMAPKLFEFVGMKQIQIGMFRYGVLGSAFQVFTVFLLIILSYFDARNKVLYLQGLFMICNALLTYITMRMGFSFYGLGYCISSIITFIASCIVIEENLRNLPYYAFVKQNSAIINV